MTRTDLALVVLRAAVGAVFVAHGADKLGAGHDRAVALFMTVGLPAPETLAWAVGALEAAAGACVLLGLATRVAGLALAAEMLVAIWTVVRPRGFLGGYEYETTLLAACLALALAGAGRLSLDARRRV